MATWHQNRAGIPCLQDDTRWTLVNDSYNKPLAVERYSGKSSAEKAQKIKGGYILPPKHIIKEVPDEVFYFEVVSLDDGLPSLFWTDYYKVYAKSLQDAFNKIQSKVGLKFKDATRFTGWETDSLATGLIDITCKENVADLHYFIEVN